MGVLTGRILMPSDLTDLTTGDASLHDKSTGALLDTITSSVAAENDKIPYCFSGDVAPTGRWCVPLEDEGTAGSFHTGIAILDDDDQVITTVTSIVSGFLSPWIMVRHDHDAHFWVLVYDQNSSGPAGDLYKFDEDGAIVQTWANIYSYDRVDFPCPSETTGEGFAVSYDGSKMYVMQGNIAPAAVYVYNTGTDSWDAAALITVAGFRSDSDGLIICDGGAGLLVNLREQFGSGNLDRTVKLYDLSGSLVATKALGEGGSHAEMAVDPSDDDTVWVKSLSTDSLTYTLYKLSSADLSELWTPVTDNTLENGGDVPASCPLLVFPGAADESAPSANQLVCIHGSYRRTVRTLRGSYLRSLSLGSGSYRRSLPTLKGSA